MNMENKEWVSDFIWVAKNVIVVLILCILFFAFYGYAIGQKAKSRDVVPMAFPNTGVSMEREGVLIFVDNGESFLEMTSSTIRFVKSNKTIFLKNLLLPAPMCDVFAEITCGRK